MMEVCCSFSIPISRGVTGALPSHVIFLFVCTQSRFRYPSTLAFNSHAASAASMPLLRARPNFYTTTQQPDLEAFAMFKSLVLLNSNSSNKK